MSATATCEGHVRQQPGQNPSDESALDSPQNFVALVPLALLLGDVTEHLAERFGDVIGGLLNASFGNVSCGVASEPLQLLAAAAEQLQDSHRLLTRGLACAIVQTDRGDCAGYPGTAQGPQHAGGDEPCRLRAQQPAHGAWWVCAAICSGIRAKMSCHVA